MLGVVGRARTGLIGAVLLGAALRFYPIWFGLPYTHARPDETTALAHAAGILAGDPNPHFFNWPSLLFYVLAGLLTAASAAKGALGVTESFLVARAGIALAGTATILVLARLARRTGDAWTAALAALFLAVAVLHVRDSHFATSDVLMTLFVVTCLTLVVEVAWLPSWRTLALAGLAGGLATSTKYSAAPLAIAVLFVWSGAWASAPRWRGTAIFLLAFAAGFVAGTPYSVLDFATLRADFLFERAHLAAGHAATDLGLGWWYHLTRSLPLGLGVTLYVAAIAGLMPLWTRHRLMLLPMGAFAALFFLAIGSGRTVFFRYVLPLVPLACLSAAVFVRWSVDALARRFTVRPAFVALPLVALVAGPSLMQSMWSDILLARTDSRVLAAEWMTARVRPDDTVYDAGGDYTRLDLGKTPFHEWRYDAATATFAGADGRTPQWIVLYDSPLRGYAAIDPSLEALTAAKYELVYEARGAGRAPLSVFDPQDAFFLPIAGFAGVTRPGPDIYVYRLR